MNLDLVEAVEQELPFERPEFEHRLDNLRRSLAAAGLDAGIYFAPEDIYYLSGYNTTGAYYGFQALVVPVKSDPFFVCRQVEESNVVARSIVDKRYVFTDTDNPAAVLVKALGAEQLVGRRLELDADSVALSPRHYVKIEQAIGEDKADTTTRCLRRVRQTKSDAEVALIRQAATVVRAGMDAAVKTIRAGSTEHEVAAACYSALILAGGEYPGMPPMIASGKRASYGHATWEGHRTIQAGDVVLLEIPGCIKRYHAVQFRCISVGTPSREYQRRMDVVLAAREAVLKITRPGVTSEAVDRALREPLKRGGLADHHVHRAGYGLGIAYPPRWDEGGILSLREGDQTELRPNMIFHLLADLYFFNETLIGCSETVLVTDTGNEVLTPYPTGFIVV